MTSTIKIINQIRALIEPLKAEDRLALIQNIASTELTSEINIPSSIGQRQTVIQEQAVWYTLFSGEEQESRETHPLKYTFAQARHLVDNLAPLDQAHLLIYLTTRLAHYVKTTSSAVPPSTSDSTTAWQEFFHLGDALTDTDTAATPTLTETILTMRR